jgi:hypothetical protein
MFLKQSRQIQLAPTPFILSGGHSSRDVANDDEDDEADDVSKVIEDLREVIRRPIGRFEAIPDDMSPQEILDQVSCFIKIEC